MSRRIYFDHAATTPLDTRVRQAMDQYQNGSYGNPSSMHYAGREAHAGVDEARADVAALVGAHPGEIIFTGSGTEADNLALRGVLERTPAGAHLVVSAFEHPAVIETARLPRDAGPRRDLPAGRRRRRRQPGRRSPRHCARTRASCPS